MVFTPSLPLSGIGGWRFLERTYDRQLESFTQSPQVANDRAYAQEKLAEPMAFEDFLDDRRLLRITMTAFGLGGEEWKRGFIDKALTEASDPESTFLQRLNNPAYTRFAEAFAPSDGVVRISEDAQAEILAQFESEAFEEAVGEIDNSMRLSLNFQGEIGDIVTDGTSEDAILFRLLGSVPVRTVLEASLNLPTDVQQLPIERQAEIFKERLQSRFGVDDVSELSNPDTLTAIVERYQAVNSLQATTLGNTSASNALILLGGGVSGAASENLFLATVSGF